MWGNRFYKEMGETGKCLGWELYIELVRTASFGDDCLAHEKRLYEIGTLEHMNQDGAAEIFFRLDIVRPR